MKILNKTILPQGFLASGIYCGVKRSKRKDLGLIYSEFASIAAGVFTSNEVKAASLKVCISQLKNKESKAIIVNSGNANCFTGKKGIKDANSIIGFLAEELNIAKKSILIASTGIIGKPMPVDVIKNGIPKLSQELNKDGLKNFADSILTTDTFRKVCSVKINIGNKPVIISGVAKGAGMIYPHLEKAQKHATMLVFILTDAAIKKSLLQTALEYAVENSFNSISVDACTSTNDTVLLLANAAAGNKTIVKKNKDFAEFCKGLSYVCQSLSQTIIDDAEGASKKIEILVQGAKNEKEAKTAANAVANSDLFKTAMFGGNPNWGRIVAAIGAAGIPVDEDKLEISFNSHKIFNKGKINPLKNKKLLVVSKFIKVNINLNNGSSESKVYTCDLTPEYIKINAEYN
ncbi:MAG: bifunctional glutamate N-acetyltransferase/amino-acid acetyltransferase ArgJ [Candidatus Omnitrophica bacterium]|nr:bifunctional glutamate N-acetyltransferase/amino-acid acetyltransferase ArgJ [Candidatus Omnitrophota bacterium]MDD5352692.1 bifunctional glutamate N-acetyltransferase/amino-acid acetyltransferase ArgJ [Candidatus Omnitrophota bacterium]MDD5550291.1 bifunctional glutamate N-acetyltransferase/amino-acid acetyltransferase ArgJ [Candidatus Omnitrophota bacterium]